MLTHDFYYDLPNELIAQHPAEQRDMSRLLVYNRRQNSVQHRVFKDIVEYLNPGDALVLNHTRVLPARLFGKRAVTGGKVEMLLLHPLSDNRYEVLVQPGKRAREGSVIAFGDGVLSAEILARTPSGGRIVRFDYAGEWRDILERVGQMPLPPYIKERCEDSTRYQPVYAKIDGSAAAPTAGLHFTPELLDTIARKSIKIHHILLHVGLGTFRPVDAEDTDQHEMHAEYYSMSEETASALNEVRADKKRIIAVGTTSVRTLESCYCRETQAFTAGSGWTRLFITPGYEIQAADAIITNFHLPESTLLMLISAFAGRERVLDIYAQAIEQRYRFFSFGDAMLIE